MKLYYSKNSPYARIIRIALYDINSSLAPEERVEEIEVVTRRPDNLVLGHSPLGRVPTLVTEGFVLGETCNIYRYLQANFVKPGFQPDWEDIALDSLATGFLDGIAVWGRESMFHKEACVSDFVLGVEAERAIRCMAYFEKLWTDWQGVHEWDFFHITLACALDMLARFERLPDWQSTYPSLANWYAGVADTPAMQATAARGD
ncbi:MAG: glutathione S-transferase family protein [Pseudomonadales bacterium]|nr:glutathione S-transferase family protein [Pseudomonadales bacterium]